MILKVREKLELEGGNANDLVSYPFFLFLVFIQSQLLDSFYLNPITIFKTRHGAGH